MLAHASITVKTQLCAQRYVCHVNTSSKYLVNDNGCVYKMRCRVIINRDDDDNSDI